MIFRNVRTPRENMMGRYASVNKDGKLELKGDLRALYGIMLETRVWIAMNAPMSLAQGLTIATRYAVVRRQFSTLEAGNKQERKLLDYQTHMFKFAPLLAYVFAMSASSIYLAKGFETMVGEMAQNNFGSLDVMHHLSAGFKAVFSRISYDGIDTARQSCGGAGFSAHSGLPSLQVDYSPNTTYEGDNTVMLQQAARLITKTWKKIYVKNEGEKALGVLSYFNDINSILESKSTIKNAEDALCLDRLEKALLVRAAFKVKYTNEKLVQKTQEGMTENERTHSVFAVDLVSMTHSHIIYVMFKLFRNQLETPDLIKCPNLKTVLLDLARLLALNELVTQDSSAVYEAGHFGPGTATILLDAMKRLLTKIRPQMIGLVESWEFPDSLLVSAIGNSYGDIYETQLEWARNSRLNATPVPKGFKEYMMPILTGKL